MSSKSRPKSGPKRKRTSDEEDEEADVRLAESGGDSSGGESDGERPYKSQHATSESELSEAKRLKSLAYSKRLLLQNSNAQQSAASLPIPSALLPHSQCDIQKKSETRANPRFLCVFPGQFRLLPTALSAIKQQQQHDDASKRRAANAAAVDGADATAASPAASSASAAGRIGSLESLDSRNPVMYVDFPTGRLKLTATIVYPADTTLLALTYPSKPGGSKGRKVKPLQCKGSFDHLLVFSDWSWLGRKDDNPTEQPLPVPNELQQPPDGLVMESSEPAEEDGEGAMEDEEEEEEEDGTRAAAQRELERDREDGVGEDEDERKDEEADKGGRRQRSGSAPKREKRDEWDSDAEEESDAEEAEEEEESERSASATRRPQRATRKAVKYDVDVQDSDDEEEDEKQEDEEEEVQEIDPKQSSARADTRRERASNKYEKNHEDDDDEAGVDGDGHSSDEDY